MRIAIPVVLALLLMTSVAQPAPEDQAAGAKAHKTTPNGTVGKIIVAPSAANPNMPFSPGVSAGGFLFVSGHIGNIPETGKIPESFDAEVRQALENVGAVLKAGGMDFGNVVNVTVYMTDLSKFADMNKVYVQYFKSERPARATVQVAKLVGAAQIEISAIAHK